MPFGSCKSGASLVDSTPEFSSEPHAADDRRHGRERGRAEGPKEKAAKVSNGMGQRVPRAFGTMAGVPHFAAGWNCTMSAWAVEGPGYNWWYAVNRRSLGHYAAPALYRFVPFYGLVPSLYRDSLQLNETVCDGLPMELSHRKMLPHKNIFAFRRGWRSHSHTVEVTSSNLVTPTIFKSFAKNDLQLGPTRGRGRFLGLANSTMRRCRAAWFPPRQASRLTSWPVAMTTTRPCGSCWATRAACGAT